MAPAIAFLLLSLVYPLRRSGKPAAWVSIVLSLGALLSAISARRVTVPDMARRMLWDWIPVEDGVLTSVGLLADADSTLMLILVALVSFLVQDRKSTRLNSSHMSISYAVFCLKTILLFMSLLV